MISFNLEIKKLGFIAEYRFHPVRKWRFDFADVENKIAIEIEGGAFIQGRHFRGTGAIKDMEKYNTATIMGWRVLRYTPQQFNNGEWLKDVMELKKIESYPM